MKPTIVVYQLFLLNYCSTYLRNIFAGTLQISSLIFVLLAHLISSHLLIYKYLCNSHLIRLMCGNLYRFISLSHVRVLC